MAKLNYENKAAKSVEIFVNNQNKGITEAPTPLEEKTTSNVDTEVHVDELIEKKDTQEMNNKKVTDISTESTSKKVKSKSVGRPKSEGETKQTITLSLIKTDYEKLKGIALVEESSASEIVGELIQQYILKNNDKLKIYEKFLELKKGK